VGKPGVVAKFDQFVVDVGVSQYLQLLDVLNHFPGFVGNEGMHKSRRPDGDSYTDHTIYLHDVVGRIVVDLEDVLEAL
jgi:hypothetical protein